MTFPQINGPADPEEFSWEVELFEEQELESIDSTHAAVYYTDGHRLAYEITATHAHDADGTDVPTSLAVSDGNVITLTVHHRAGDSNGAPFEHPIIAGTGWVSIDAGQVVPVLFPVSESSVAKPWEEESRGSRFSPRCSVPRLRGTLLAAAKRSLQRANCRLGRVHRRRGANAMAGRVTRQSPRPGRTFAGSTAVDVTVVARRVRGIG